MRREPKVQPRFASLGSKWLMAASPENVCVRHAAAVHKLQHQPVGSLASTAANELLCVLSRSLLARSSHFTRP
jgi:hypothetical protein